MTESSQTAIFDEALASIGEEIQPEMVKWDFPKMIEVLRAAIISHSPRKKGKAIRHFSRNFLHIHGNGYLDVQRWTRNEVAMSKEEIILVLRTLSRLDKEPAQQVSIQQAPVVSSKPKRGRPPGSRNKDKKIMGAGIQRKVVDHTISSLNSLVGLITEAKVTRDAVFDGDRMQMVGALQRMCSSFGINAVFPEKDSADNQPLTMQEMNEVGFQMKGSK